MAQVKIERVRALADRLGIGPDDPDYPGQEGRAVSDVFVLLERLVDIWEAADAGQDS